MKKGELYWAGFCVAVAGAALWQVSVTASSALVAAGGLVMCHAFYRWRP